MSYKSRHFLIKNNIVKGYYDLEVYNASTGLVLLLEVTRNIWLTPKGFGRIIVLDLKTDNVVFRSEWNAVWNWQQASRQCWMNEEEFVYNSYNSEDDNYCSVIINYLTGDTRLVNSPIQTKVDPHHFVSIDYKRLNVCRPDYGYNHHKVSNANEALKIKLINTIDGTAQEMVHFDAEKLKLSNWRLNHILVSRNYLIFLERYEIQGRTVHKLWRVDMTTGEKEVLNSIIHVSHYCFVADDVILITAQRDKVWFLEFINVKEDCILSSVPFFDCHPTFIKGGLVVADRYTDGSGMKRLYKILYDESSFEIFTFSEIYASPEPFHLTDVRRCDLHVNVLTESSVIIDESNLKKRYVTTIQI